MLNRSLASKVHPQATAAATETLDMVRRKGGQKSALLTLKPDNRDVWLL